MGRPRSARRPRRIHVKVGGICTTEKCNLSCTMCHFHGPEAPRRGRPRTLAPDLVAKFIGDIPEKQDLWFASTGEFFMDPHALEHLRLASQLGHRPRVLTNGQLLTRELIDNMLEAGVRFVRFSVDAIDPERYGQIRRGGQFEKVLEACAYLRAKKREYPGLTVGISNTLFEDSVSRQDEFIRFWRGKADRVAFNAQYYDIFKFKHLFFTPPARVPCELQLYLLPSGAMVPCCALEVYEHCENLDWLPNIASASLREAFELFKRMYADSSSPLRQICAKCEWWVVSVPPRDGRTPFWRDVVLPLSLRDRIIGRLRRRWAGKR